MSKKKLSRGKSFNSLHPTRFKKGVSGNPKGRPKGSKKNLFVSIRQELARVLTVREGGKTRKMTVRDIIAKKWITQALEGDPRAIRELLALDSPPSQRDEASQADWLNEMASARETLKRKLRRTRIVIPDPPEKM
jgi:hypothetical protein